MDPWKLQAQEGSSYHFGLTLPWGTLPCGTLPWGALPWETLPGLGNPSLELYNGLMCKWNKNINFSWQVKIDPWKLQAQEGTSYHFGLTLPWWTLPKDPFPGKGLEGPKQINGFSSVWLLSCIFKSLFSLNVLSHLDQAKYFSPVWIIAWLFKCIFGYIHCHIWSM